ncbi:PREDICTED: COMM domain-containing protein 1-like [Amphimedon queenslandica]|uniref:COMM domain-containing protein 1 n=1 Tax=Amphimedon queenslandica TaxID=400682 RepID=A0A1X7VTD8_AMPQE|nr:PREDICTED: COMM domain-containing protein 1-like [Amphimedon queenslandica]|eukprot:XP_003382677.1 PREDICTED: COMM domain-containing protein 1-like [Amphimedon queenslandica]
MSSGEIDKTLLAFLNGLSRRQYFGEDQFSDQFLREEILGNIDVEDYMGMLKRFQTIITTMASGDMDYAQLDAFLTSQMKKRQAPLTEVEAATVRRFWKNQKNKIHEQLSAQAVWDSQLKAINWRVDVQSKARHIDQLNQPSAIVEMKIGKSCTEEVSDIVRFEVDAQKLSGILSQVGDIQTAIEANMQA